MVKLKVLNLYAGIGGNRKLWEDVEVTAIENNESVAQIYQDFFPDDKIIIADAHQYLLDHFKEFDFIWSSPPCPSHTKIRNEAGVGRGQNKPIYPELKLYEEIILLKHLSKLNDNGFDGLYCIENVISYYDPLIKPMKSGLHYFWANFLIGRFDQETRNHWDFKQQRKDIFNIQDKVLLRNCVNPQIGLYILNCARNIISKSTYQTDLFL